MYALLYERERDIITEANGNKLLFSASTLKWLLMATGSNKL